MPSDTYILGGYQTDFSANWARNGIEIFDAFRNTVLSGLEATGLEPSDVAVAHVGNFAAELFCGQGHLGGFFAATDPAFAGLPASRHEGACASGSLAALAASADLESGRYDLAAVIGIEQMRNIPGDQAAAYIGGTAMWAGHECQGVKYPWPHMFSLLAEEYERRYGLRHEHLAQIAQINFANAKRNPNAQTRKWVFQDTSFTADERDNPVIDGRIRKQDCGQISDGAAIVFLATPARAARYAATHGIELDSIPRIRGWGHRRSPMPPRSRRAVASRMCFHTCAARLPMPSAARGSRPSTRSMPSRRMTVSRRPSTWPSITSASPHPARAGKRSRTETSRSAGGSR
jgi:acetyl-CoA C-acetyltransferase